MGIPGFRGFDQNTVRDSGKNNGIRDLTAAGADYLLLPEKRDWKKIEHGYVRNY